MEKNANVCDNVFGDNLDYIKFPKHVTWVGSLGQLTN